MIDGVPLYKEILRGASAFGRLFPLVGFGLTLGLPILSAGARLEGAVRHGLPRVPAAPRRGAESPRLEPA